MNKWILWLVVICLGLTTVACDTKDQNMILIEQILKADYQWIYSQYFQQTNSSASTIQGFITLDILDQELDKLQYMDNEKTVPVTKQMKDHLRIASFSQVYKTLIQNFKVDKKNGKYEEVLLVSRIENDDLMNFIIIQGSVLTVPIPKYSSYDTTKCECDWTTLCIRQICRTERHFVQRAYTGSEYSNLKTAMRFITYKVILEHCYLNRDKLDFTGLTSFTQYVKDMNLPPRLDQAGLLVQQNGLSVQISNQMMDNDDDSIFLDDDKTMELSQQKKQLYRLALKQANYNLVENKMFDGISKMEIHGLENYEPYIKQISRSIHSSLRIAIQLWILRLDVADQKWNMVQVVFNQDGVSLVTNLVFKKGFQSQSFAILNSQYYSDSLYRQYENGTILMKWFEQNDDNDILELKEQKSVVVANIV